MSLKSQGKSTHKTKKKYIKTRKIKTLTDTNCQKHISGMSGDAGKSTLGRKLSSEPNIIKVIKRSRHSKHIITGDGADSRKIKINESNSEIKCINTKKAFNAYKTEIMRITGICEPDDKDENGNVIEPQMNPPHDKYWLILYKKSETGNADLAGYIKTTDLEQYTGGDMVCFEKLGGKSDKRGIQLSGVCANTEKYSGVASPLLNKIDEFAKAKKYNYILLHAGTTRNYLISDNRDRPGLYVKHKYKKVGNLKANECGFADIDLVIMRKEFQ